MTLNLIRSCQLISMSSATTLDMRALISATALSVLFLQLDWHFPGHSFFRHSLLL
jgi:hypothetical protein